MRGELLPRREHGRELLEGPVDVERRDGRERMRAKRPASDDPEVPSASAAAGPVEIRVLARAADEQLPSGRDHVECEHVVRGQAPLPQQEAVPAAECEAAHAHGRARARREREPLLAKPLVDVEQPGARADDGARPLHADRVEPADVEDHPGRGRVAAIAVPAAPGGDPDPALPRPRDPARDVAGAVAVRDRERPHAVERRAEEEPRLRIARIGAADDVALQEAVELPDARIPRRTRESPPRRDADRSGDPARAAQQFPAVERLPRLRPHERHRRVPRGLQRRRITCPTT